MEFSKIFKGKISIAQAKRLSMRKRTPISNVPSHKLSFSFLESYPENVLLETASIIVGKSGSSLLYSVKAHPEWASAKPLADAMKSYMVDLVVEAGNMQYGIGDKNAIDSAASILSEHFGVQQNSIAVKAAVLDLFGYGPLSFLLEDSANIEEIVINGPLHPLSPLLSTCLA